MFKEYETVLPSDIEFRRSLGPNVIGTVLIVYEEPRRAYEVEFCDQNGKTIALRTMSDDELIPHTHPANFKPETLSTFDLFSQ